MSLGSPTVPTAPTATTSATNLIDPFALANLQQTYNVGAGVGNQLGSFPTYNTPTYSQTYSQIGTGAGGVPIYGINQTLSPQLQNNLAMYLNSQANAGTISNV